jgi:uncharacterized protein (DUF169 family)
MTVPNSDYTQISDTLVRALELRQPPIAVCFGAEPAADLPRYTGRVPAGCAFWERAMSGGFSTLPVDHESCTIGTFTHGMAPSTPGHESERAAALTVFAELGYVRSEDIPQIATMGRLVETVSYAPLAEIRHPPDVVLVFANSQQGLIVAEAAGQLDQGAPPALGRPACAIVPQAVRTGRAALSLGCCGARAYLDVLRDDVALWALPGHRLEEYAARIAELAKANSVLSRFHTLRREDIEAGLAPTLAASLARLGSA